MKEVTLNPIIEVHHIDGWKHVIKKESVDFSEPSCYMLNISYCEEINGEWSEEYSYEISSMILPEFIDALNYFNQNKKS